MVFAGGVHDVLDVVKLIVHVVRRRQEGPFSLCVLVHDVLAQQYGSAQHDGHAGGHDGASRGTFHVHEPVDDKKGDGQGKQVSHRPLRELPGHFAEFVDARDDAGRVHEGRRVVLAQGKVVHDALVHSLPQVGDVRGEQFQVNRLSRDVKSRHHHPEPKDQVQDALLVLGTGQPGVLHRKDDTLAGEPYNNDQGKQCDPCYVPFDERRIQIWVHFSDLLLVYQSIEKNRQYNIQCIPRKKKISLGHSESRTRDLPRVRRSS